MTGPHDPFRKEPQAPPPPGQYGTPPAGYPPPPGYGAYPPAYPPGYPPVRGTNVLAIVALVSIFVFTPAALVLGIIARNQIKQTGEQGDGMALAAIIIGAIATAFFVIFLLFFVFAVASLGFA